MFNLLNKIVSDIQFRIPREILIEAFINSNPYRTRTNISLDEAILQDVIRKRVMVDLNLIGGNIANISLEGLTPQMLDEFTYMYIIPPERTGNRGIVSVLSASYIPYSLDVYGAYATSVNRSMLFSSMDILTAGAKLYNSHANVLPVANADIELTSPLTIVIRYSRFIYGYFTLRAILAYDEALNQINPRSYLYITKLCELATKSYIYITLKIRMDRAALAFGQELGAFKEIVESYADAEENYQTYMREVVQNVLYMNDKESYRRFIKLQIMPTL